MIVREKAKHTIEGDSFLTVQSSVNKEKLAKLYGILSNIYRNPIGAIVREYASNAYDANIEAWNFKTLGFQEIWRKYPWVREGKMKMDIQEYTILVHHLTHTKKDSPIRIGFEVVGGTCYFTIQDFGIGLSPKRMEHIYFNYLDTTKDNTDDEIGGFGIGAKSALAYTKTFHINTVYNGDEYNYIMTKGETGIPEGQLLNFFENADKPNGTIIKVPIKSSDIHQFISECSKQLRYMENVYFDNPNNIANGVSVLNDATIYSGKGWRHSDNEIANEELSLCLNNIRYTIDWSEIGMKQIIAPISLVFDIGELQPTPSRESIVYTKEAKELIIKRINEFYDHVIDKIKKFRENITTPSQYNIVQGCATTTCPDFIKTDDYWLRLAMGSADGFMKRAGGVKDIVPFFKDLVNPKSMVRGLNDRIRVTKTILKDGNITNSIYKVKIFENDKMVPFIIVRDVNNTNISAEKCRFILENVTKDVPYNLIYIRSVSTSSMCYFLGWDYSDIDPANLSRIRDDFDKHYYQYLENDPAFMGYYEDIIVNPNWSKLYAAGKTKYFGGRVSTINTNPGYHSRRYLYFNRSDYDSQKLTVDQYAKEKLIIYGEHKDSHNLLLMAQFLHYNGLFSLGFNRGLTVRSFAPTVLKKISELNLPNMHTINDFILNEFRPLKRIATAIYITEEFHRWIPDVSSSPLCEFINEDIYKKVIKLENYVYSNLSVQNMRAARRGSEINQLKHQVYKACQQANLFDHHILAELEEVVSYFKDLPLLGYVVTSSSRDDFHKTLNDAALEYVRCKGKKINYSHYLKPAYRK